MLSFVIIACALPQVTLEGLTLPEDVSAGEYRLKIWSAFAGPFGDLKPQYLTFTVE